MTETVEGLWSLAGRSRRIQGEIGDVMRVLRMIEHVMKAGTAARSAGYRASYLDRAMTEGSSFSTVRRFVTMATLGYGRKHWYSRM